SQWAVHRHPDLWPEPDSFRPERWDPVQSQHATPWSYFPFGGGPRICLGKSLAQLEVFLVLPIILQQYAPRVLAGHVVEPLPLIPLRARRGLPVRLEPVPQVRASDLQTAERPSGSQAECPVHRDNPVAHGLTVV